MIAALNSLPPLHALAVSAVAPGVVVIVVAFLAYDAGRLVRLAITGRL